MPKRIFEADVRISCCVIDKHEELRYRSIAKKFIIIQELPIFKLFLREWRWDAQWKLREVLLTEGDVKCKNLSGSLELCGYSITNVEVREE